ncbi:ABC transporter ATP-binding protein [Paenibacillus sp. sptzw28]|uniref:ABC transporter ATP-binding protein n=1 Tax=Paenibacillus sp. sptzw28 TaxID=715179 RepID=UPI001C6ECF15|nr:ABC transporter ATP-binding protein [Paenibacillus sp. sptzw28]QYR23007.1 ABC transporter ATP-binding protein [Paenibacillus sp. sptzw28]
MAIVMEKLRVNNLSYRYKGTDRPAVEQISFTVEEGEVVGLLGHNGAGKTTILKCIAGLLKPGEGEASLGGAPSKEGGGAEPSLGYVPSDIYLYNLLTVEEMIRFTAGLHGLPRTACEKRMNELLHVFQLDDKRSEYVKTLSHGMKQKVAMITGVIHHPGLLVLDEPMTGYDALSTKETKTFLLSYAKERKAGVLLSSHRLDIVEDICRRVVVIHAGTMVYSGGIQDLKKQAHASGTLEEALLRISGEEAGPVNE